MPQVYAYGLQFSVKLSADSHKAADVLHEYLSVYDHIYRKAVRRANCARVYTSVRRNFHALPVLRIMALATAMRLQKVMLCKR